MVLANVSWAAAQEAVDGGAPIQLDAITIDAVLEGTVTESYAAPDSFAATRTDTPLIETPVSAQSITRQALQDAGAETFADAYDYLAGVTRDNTQGGLQGDEYIVRGFDTDNILFNGNRTSSASTLDIANVERIEALRGPTAVLFGKGDPGGLINVVTKQPLSETRYEVDVSGAAGFTDDGDRLRNGRLTADLGGPLTDDGRLRYRFNTALEQERSYRQDVDEQLLFLSPVVEYAIDERTVANVEFTYQYREDTFDRGLFLVNDEFALDRDFNPAKGNTGDIEKHYLSGTVRVDRELRPGWKARLGVYGSYDEREGDAVQQDSINGTTLLRERRRIDVSDRFFTLQPELTGEFETGTVGHTLLVGLDVGYEDSRFAGVIGPGGGPVDVFDPDFSTPIPPLDASLATPGSASTRGELSGTSIGLYLQDQIDLSEQWKVLVGARYDHVDLEAENRIRANVGAPALFAAGQKADFEDEDISPRVGVLYRPVEFMSVFASYAESYRPPSDAFRIANAQGDSVEAETAKSYEVGIKMEAFDGRLSGTLSAYRIDKKNVLESDPDDPLGLAVTNLGKVRGEGFEFDVAGEPVENLSFALSYAYTDTRTDEATPRLERGTRLRNIPRHAASAQVAYRFTSGSLRGLRVSGGLVAESDRLTDTSNDIDTTLPGYARLDVGASYAISEAVEARVFVENVTDREYYTSAAGRNNIGIGDPLRVSVGLRAKF